MRSIRLARLGNGVGRAGPRTSPEAGLLRLDVIRLDLATNNAGIPLYSGLEKIAADAQLDRG